MLRRIHFHRCNCLTLSYFSVSLCFFPIFFLNRQKTLKAWHKSCWGRSLQDVLLKAFKYSVCLYSPIVCRTHLGLCNICSDVWWESPSTDTKQDISVWIQTVGQPSVSAGFWDSLYSLWKEKKIKKKKKKTDSAVVCVTGLILNELPRIACKDVTTGMKENTCPGKSPQFLNQLRAGTEFLEASKPSDQTKFHKTQAEMSTCQ